MKKTIANSIYAMILGLALSGGTNALAQKNGGSGADPKGRLILAINEGAAGNVTATDISFRYEQFKQIVEKALGAPVTLVGVRDARMLRKSVQSSTFAIILSRPADVLAEAVRDYGYQAIVVSQEPAHALFIVRKDSPLKTIGDVKGKSILTPDRYAYMWRIANAMMRDNKISMAQEQVRAMSDQAAIGWSMEGGFFDVGVVASFSGVGRTWEKNGGRVIARSPELPNTPMIASQKISPAQIQKLRSALIALRNSENGAAVLKDIGVPGFKEASSQSLIELITWLGDLDVPKE
ncbi:MAG TPA: PhnD/SsuA/transferrin family substrate-binding protein [Burkholderiales bacterium]|nr:PhnD/SsuA/transferrin family substrate-binding protein [Burkholderiales bacterium]